MTDSAGFTVRANGSNPALMPSSALDLKGVTCGYGRTVVLRDVSLQVPAGRVVALLGPNGAGKTTLLRTVSGFLRPSAGTVELFGDDVTGTAAYRRFEAGLCHVPEGRGVFRSLSVKENLIMQARKGEEAEAIAKAVEAFPILGSRIGQLAGTMSGGEQQMLAMASAYVRDPKLILVDEASLGLAPLIVEQIFGFMERMAKEGSSLLVVDQFAARALAMAETAYVLSRGIITYAGLPSALGEQELIKYYLGG
jgi:branched-chain amino acid transport system ATP-binding protein